MTYASVSAWSAKDSSANSLRLRSYRCKAVLIESGLCGILQGRYQSKVTPQSMIGSIASWQTRYAVPFVFCGDHAGAAVYALAMIRTYMQHVNELVTAYQKAVTDDL